VKRALGRAVQQFRYGARRNERDACPHVAITTRIACDWLAQDIRERITRQAVHADFLLNGIR